MFKKVLINLLEHDELCISEFMINLYVIYQNIKCDDEIT